MKMPQKPADLNHFPQAAAPAAEFNNCVEAENDRRITGLACASPAPVGPFRSRQTLESLKTKNIHTIRLYRRQKKLLWH